MIPGTPVFPKDPRRQPDGQSIDLSQLQPGLFSNQVSEIIQPINSPYSALKLIGRFNVSLLGVYRTTPRHNNNRTNNICSTTLHPTESSPSLANRKRDKR